MGLKEDINKSDKKINEMSFAMEMLEFSKTQANYTNRRYFIIIIILILTLVGSITFNFYLLNSTEEVSTTSSSIDIDNVEHIQDSDVSNNLWETSY